MIIPLDQLSEDTLTAIIEDFILREDTEQTDINTSQQVKIAQVKQRLRQGEALIVYSQLYESVNIIPSDKYSEHEEN